MPLCYVLHSRPYKETSALVDLFCAEGRFRAVLRGARGRSGARVRAFAPLDVEWRGRSDLKSVARIEPVGQPFWLVGEALFSGLYLNELILRLLGPEDPQPALFEQYALTLQALALGRPLQPLLRGFEWGLLCTLGYGFSLVEDIRGQPIEASGLYRLLPDAGLEAVGIFQPGVIQGDQLLAMADTDWSYPGALQSAKRLMRQALAPHLGGRPLASRELFINLKETPRD